jgi:peptidoglycan/LPS O-acetylase OafA/YrhL
MGRADSNTKFTLVQALRGIAALWVVLFHAAEGKHLESIRAATPTWFFDGIFSAGHYGVAIFFALSGFVIAHSLRNADATPGFAGRFILRRSIRLDPPYWAIIALVVGQQMIEARIKGTVSPDISLAQLVAHVFYIQDVLGYPQISAVFWTLCFEIQFYLGFMLLLMVEQYLIRRFGPRIGAIVRVVMFGAALIGALRLYSGIPTGIALTLWHAFFIGVLAYWAGQGTRIHAVMLLILFFAMTVRGATDDMISAVTAAALYLAFRTGRLATTWASPPMQWLGMISYSLYLSHNIVAGSAYWALGKVMSNGIAAESVQLLLVTGMSLLFAYALWWLVERPAHDFAKRLGRSR